MLTVAQNASAWIPVPLLLLAAGCGSAEPTASLEGIRRGTVWIEVTEPTDLRVTIEPTHGGDDFAYLSGPDGRTLVRKKLAQGYGGVVSDRLTMPGLYRLVPSPSHRMRVEVDRGAIAFEPELEFPSLFIRRGTLAFDVPDTCRSFTLAATSQHDWGASAGSVVLRDPEGTRHHAFAFEDLDQSGILSRLGITPELAAHYEAQGDTAEVPEFRLLIDRVRVQNPRPGRWTVEASIDGLRADDIGYWIEEGLPNRFVPLHGTSPTATPAPVAATVRVAADDGIGATGDVGTVWGWTIHREEAEAAFREMGLTASKHFYPQVDMEVVNDDDDPRSIRDAGFLFAPFVDRLDVYRERTLPLTALMVISRIAPWAQPHLPEVAEYAEAAVRYHQVTAGLDPAGLYWQFLNEPNHYASLAEYVPAYLAAGERLRETLEAEGIPVRFGGPATGNVWGDREAVPWSWIESLLREADEVTDFVVWNQYALGRLEDTWRYRDHILHADSLIHALDSDGQVEEILIGATNLRGGVVLQNERQDGAYSALWWPSVLCQSLGTGRVRVVNYFFLIDQGARRKGLLFPDWTRKPVALATAFVSRHRGEVVVRAETDHDGLDVLATRGRLAARTDRIRDGEPDPGALDPTDPLYVVLVNRTDHEMTATLDLQGLHLDGESAGWQVEAESFDAATGSTRPWRMARPGRAPGGEVVVAPGTVVGVTLRPASVERPGGR